MQTLIDKAQVLIEALPYIRRYYDKVLVVKYGGHAMVDDDLRASFAVDIVLLRYIGLRPVIVHGGGPQIGRTLERLGKTSRFVRGMRVTDDETMEVVEMVLGGKVNQDIVELVTRGGGRAAGLTGIDGAMIRARRRRMDGDDLGRVGEVVSIDAQPIVAMANGGFIPVIAPLGVDEQGVTYNINADEAAGALASALGAEKLILLTDVEGVKDPGGALIGELSADGAQKLVDEGTIREGMIPKVECCIEALRAGVPRAHIVDGRLQHAILLEIFTDKGVGTLLSR